MFVRLFIISALLISGTASCDDATSEGIKLTSPAFEDGKSIPIIYTCDGKDISPELVWNDPPEGTATFALICDDPDAPSGTWVHWVIYDIPDTARNLQASFPDDPVLPDSIIQGRNSFGRIGYGGPCPPHSTTHRYYFKIYALDVKLNLSGSLSKSELEKAMDGHILAEGQLMGKYGR